MSAPATARTTQCGTDNDAVAIAPIADREGALRSAIFDLGIWERVDANLVLHLLEPSSDRRNLPLQQQYDSST